jgi:DNA polymerase III sliding clamp (beta) subunit (PCNA family)
MHIIPVESARELINKISEDENIEITVQDNKITFNSPSHSLTTELIQGKFPSYYKVIPTSFNIKMKVPKGRLSDAIRSVVKDRFYKSEEVGSYERIKLIPQKNKLTVSTLSSNQPLPIDYKSKVHSVVAETIYNHFSTGDEDSDISPHIYLNDMYLRQALNTIEGAKVMIGIINEYKPVAITSPNPEDGYLALIMPMNPDGNPEDQLVLIK